LGGALIPFLRRPILSLLSLIAITVIYLAIARLAYDRSGFLLASVPVLSTLLLCGVSTLGIDYAMSAWKSCARDERSSVTFKEPGQRNSRESSRLLQFAQRIPHAGYNAFL